jgi:two-component system, chemotaxis family, response regulator Rcp1
VTRALGRPAEILLVEDNPGDIDLMVEIFGESTVPNHVSTAKDGVEAMAFLRQDAPYKDSPRPDLIVLDLNLPKKDGREVLAELKADQDLKDIPVVVFTSSDAERDLLETYRLHANCFITKPGDLNDFFSAVKLLEKFWLEVVQLP